MYLKAFLYVLVLIITIWALNSININNLFKKNKYYASRVLYLIVSMALAYLVVNFLYDFFNYSRIV